MLNKLYNQIKESEFEDLFQPASPEELKGREESKLARILENALCTLNPDGTYSCRGSLYFDDQMDKLPVKFKEVEGVFFCDGCSLKTLEGFPDIIGSWCEVSHNDLTSLEGGPSEVGGSFSCAFNNLTTLEGGPDIVGGDYHCNNNKLETLKGLPDILDGGVSIDNNPLITEITNTSFLCYEEMEEYKKLWPNLF